MVDLLYWSQSEGLVHWFFQFCRNLFYHSDATTLNSNWNAVQWKHDIYLSSIQQAIFFFKRLRTATCWLTLRQILRICPSNLSLLSRVTLRSSISSWIGITVTSQVNTGFLSTLPNVIAWYFEWFFFHLIEFIPLINLSQIGIYGMFNLVDIFRRLKLLSVSGVRE